MCNVLGWYRGDSITGLYKGNKRRVALLNRKWLNDAEQMTELAVKAEKDKEMTKEKKAKQRSSQRSSSSVRR